MRGQRKNPRKAVQPFENKKRKIDIFKNYEANGVEKIQRKLEIFSTLISKKSTNKFQTGFDQPKLCALYIDKAISNDIEIVQTYSRVNRIYPGKDQVFIVDFVNKPETVLGAFKKYDTGAKMTEGQDPNIVYKIKQRLDATNIYSQQEFNHFRDTQYKAIVALTQDPQQDNYRKQLYQAVNGLSLIHI